MKRFCLIFALLILVSAKGLFSQWSLTNGPYGATLDRITAINNTLIATRYDAFAQCDHYFSSVRGHLLWESANYDLPVINSFYSYENTVYANTEEGIYVTTDEGATWKSVFGNLPNQNVERLHISGANIYALVNKGYLYISDNSGISWTRAKDGDQPIVGASCITATSTGDTIFVGYKNSSVGMRVSYNRGKKWDSLFTVIDHNYKTFYSLDVIDENIIACGDHGIFLSADGGKKWSASSLGWDIGKIMKIDSLYAVFSTETRRVIMLTKNENNTFSPLRYLPVKIQANDFTVKDGIIYAVSTTGVHISTDLGETWTEHSDGLNKCYATGLAVEGNRLYASVFKKGFYQSTDKGLSWEKKSTDPDLLNFSTVVPAGEFLFGLYELQNWYTISKNGGVTWDNYFIPNSEALPNYVHITKDAILMGTSSGIYVSSDSGRTFSEVDESLADVSISQISGNSSYLFASSKGGLYRSSDEGKSWTKVENQFKSNNLKGVKANENLVVAYNYDGWTYVSYDQGLSWKTINQPFTSIQLVSIVGNNIFAVALNDNLYLSRDRGESWAPVGNAFYKNTINSIATDDENIYAATNAGIYKARLSDFGVNSVDDDESKARPGSDIQIYPNPASDFIKITNVELPTTIELFNSHGEKILSATNSDIIDVRSLPLGIYYARVYNQQSSSFTKFIVLR